jgi:hypothetical protein
MLETWWQDLVHWWSALAPEHVFLFALPFVVALAGGLGAWWRAHRRAREPHPPPNHARQAGTRFAGPR